MSVTSRLLVLLFLSWASVGRAQPTMHDLIPANAAAGIAVRNLEDLQKKGDKLVEQTQWKAPLRPSELFNQLYSMLGIAQGLDRKGSGAAVLMNPKEYGADSLGGFLGDVLAGLVILVPFEDADKIAANFEIKKGDLKAGTIIRGKGPSFGTYFSIRGKHLFIAGNEKVLRAVLDGKSSAEGLTDAQKRSLDEADLLVHLGVAHWNKDWGGDWDEICKQLEDNWPGSKDPAAVHDFTEALKAVRYFQAGLHIKEEGVHLQVVSRLDPKKTEAARKLLTALRAGSGGSRLTGLPEGRVVTALAFGGDGLKSAAYTRLWLHLLLQNTPGPHASMAAADRALYLGVFSEVWKRLQGGRAALYHNPLETKLGLFSAVAILDVEDPAAFVGELRNLMRLGDGHDLKLDAKGANDDVKAVQRLVRDLGSDDYATREAATTKLRLLGELALPFLEEGLKVPDAEVRRRASGLKEEIVATAETRRKELLEKNVPHPVHPTFTFVPKVQQLDGHDVDVIRIGLTGSDAAAGAKLRQLFGPDWDKLRLVVHGKQVLVLLGSNEQPLREALANVKEGRPGLAAAKPLASFHKQAGAGRTADLHLALRSITALVKAEDLEKPAAATENSLTSLALTADEERLQLDVILPIPELAVVLNQLGF